MLTTNVLDELLRFLRRSTSQDAGRDARGLVEWLHQRIGAHIALVDADGTADLRAGDLADEDLETLRPVLGQVSGGRVAAASARVGTLQVHCEGLGRGVPRPVLVVAGPSRLSPEAMALASHTGAVLDALRRIGSFKDLASRHTQVAHRLRVAVFMALMVGDPQLARRMTADAVPPLLDAERLRVLLLRCPPGDRVRLVESRQDALGYHGRDLMVRCAAYEEHVVCLEAVDGDGDDDANGNGTDRNAVEGNGADGTGAGGAGGLEALLRAWVRDNPTYALGISAPLPLGATEAAYDQARQALAVAWRAPGRVAAYRGQVALARVLPRREAVAWAREALRPLGRAPRLTVEVLRLSLGFSRSGVARLLGLSRNTVSAHLRRAENLLGADLRDIDDRARLALALAITDPPAASADTRTAADVRTPVPSLDDLLTDDVAVSWARTYLRPFQQEEHRLVYETVRCWVENGTDAQRTARVLGVSRNTVGARLRVAERLLNRDLLVPSPGIHDLFHAVAIVNRVPDLV